MNSVRRSIDGIITDAGWTKTSFAEAMHMTRATLYRKIRSRNFTAEEIRRFAELCRIDDPALVYDLFLRNSSQ